MFTLRKRRNSRRKQYATSHAARVAEAMEEREHVNTEGFGGDMLGDEPTTGQRIKRAALTTATFLLVAAIFDTALINWLFFPMCSRATGDCFLIQYLWV